MLSIKLCFKCLHEIKGEPKMFEGRPWCATCWFKGAPEHVLEQMKIREELGKVIPVDRPVENVDMINKPPHYHSNGMDTFTFLKEGFPPEVFRGFCIGNIIKYTQRYQLKGGIEDLEKVVKYTTELIEWDKKNPSL